MKHIAFFLKLMIITVSLYSCKEQVVHESQIVEKDTNTKNNEKSLILNNYNSESNIDEFKDYRIDNESDSTLNIRSSCTDMENAPSPFPIIIEPKYLGGDDSLTIFIQKKIQKPDTVLNGYRGIVFVKLFVDKEGNVTDYEILRGFNCNECNKEALRIAKKIVKVEPGYKLDKYGNKEYINTDLIVEVEFTAE